MVGFPVCSCFRLPRVHIKGLILTNVPELSKHYTECNAPETGSKDQAWNSHIADGTIKRIAKAIPECRVPKHHQQHIIINQELESAVGSATKPQRPPPVEHGGPGARRQVQDEEVQTDEEEDVSDAGASGMLCLRQASHSSSHQSDQNDLHLPSFVELVPGAAPGILPDPKAGDGAGVLSGGPPSREQEASSQRGAAVMLPSPPVLGSVALAFDIGCKGGRVVESHDIRGKAPNQKVVVFADSLYPTEQAVKQKEERKAREEKLAEEGLSPEEIKKLRKRKKFDQEAHFDDCGSDLGPLEEKGMTSALAYVGDLSSAISYSFFDEDAYNSSGAESSEEELDKVVDSGFSLHYLVGSSGATHHVDPPKSRVICIEDLDTYLAQPELKGCVDVVEVFGGESGFGKLCIRRRLVRGENFDLVIGFDLTKTKHQEEVVRYFDTHKPLVAVLGPPCIGFGHWSNLNRYVHLCIWSRSREICETFAEFVARLCLLRLREYRHSW